MFRNQVNKDEVVRELGHAGLRYVRKNTYREVERHVPIPYRRTACPSAVREYDCPCVDDDIAKPISWQQQLHITVSNIIRPAGFN